MRWRVAALAALTLYMLSLRAAGAVADAPLGRYTVRDGTVRDNSTQLTWQQTLDSTATSEAGAENYCATLPLAGGRFRLPTVRELRTILDVTRVAPAIDPNAFPDTPTASFWTSTPYLAPDGNNWMWYVDFGDGGSYGQPATNSLRVRCVR
jgi:hypothetical protein